MRSILHQTGLIIAGAALGSGITIGIQSLHANSDGRKKVDLPSKRVLETPLLIRGEPKLGSENSPITIVEFSDFQCPFCKKFHDQVFAKLDEEYISKGLVRFIHKDLPLPFHSYAYDAAAIARCSRSDKQYWSIYRAFFNKQNCMSCLGPKTIATASAISSSEIERCLKKGRIREVINSNLSEAKLHLIQATPTFIIGRTSPEIHTGEIIEGAIPWSEFKKIVERKLAEAKQSSGL